MVEKVVVPEMKKAYEVHRPFEFWLLDLGSNQGPAD